MSVLARLNYSGRKLLTNSNLIEETLDGVLHQAADGHRADTARDRSDDRGFRLDGGEVHVTAEVAVLVTVHSYIDHSGTVLDHISGHELGATYGNDKDVCLPCDFREVLRP